MDDRKEKPCRACDTQAFLPHKQETAKAVNFVDKQRNPDELFVGKICNRDSFKEYYSSFVHVQLLSHLY